MQCRTPNPQVTCLIMSDDNIQDVQVEWEIPVVLYQEFDHIVSYMYGNDIYVGDSHLVELSVLMDNLKMRGHAPDELRQEIRKFCDKDRCVSYLQKAEKLASEDLIWLCGDSILQNLAQISWNEWLTIPITSFLQLIHQAVSGGISQYSDFIVCELIMQYLKAKMSESHSKAKDIVGMLDTADISSVSLDHALVLIKICDVLFAGETHEWKRRNVAIYQLSMRRISKDFTPDNEKLCQQLQGLSPITFSKVLINADHLVDDVLVSSLREYKAGNHAAYFCDDRLKIPYILRQRESAIPKVEDVEMMEVMEEVKANEEYATPIGTAGNTPVHGGNAVVSDTSNDSIFKSPSKRIEEDEHLPMIPEPKLDTPLEYNLDNPLEGPLESLLEKELKGTLNVEHDLFSESLSGSSRMDEPGPLATMVSPLDLVNNHSRSGTRSPSHSPDYSVSYSGNSDFTPPSGMASHLGTCIVSLYELYLMSMYMMYTKGGSKTVNRSGKMTEPGVVGFGCNESPLMRRNTVRKRNLNLSSPEYDSQNDSQSHRRLTSDEMEDVMRKLTEFEAM